MPQFLQTGLIPLWLQVFSHRHPAPTVLLAERHSFVTYLIEAGYDYPDLYNQHNPYNQENWTVGSTQTP